METSTLPPRAGPERILQLAEGFQALYALASALELRIFTHMAEGKASVPAVAAAAGASERGVARLLDVLVALGFLVRTGANGSAHHALAPEAAAFLVEGRPSYLGGYIRFMARRIGGYWQRLSECVRTGEPVSSLEQPEEGAPWWEELVDLLFPWNYPAALQLAKELRDAHSGGELRVLDVAAGSGVWGIAMAQADSTARVTAFDLPGVLVYAQRNAQAFGVAGQFEFRAGDIRRDGLGEAEFDVAILGQICHSEGAENTRRLLAKVARALRPGGVVVIADMLPNEDRSGPLFTLLYALSMLTMTSEGDTFTFAEYDTWLREAGFGDAQVKKIVGQSIVRARQALETQVHPSTPAGREPVGSGLPRVHSGSPATGG